MKHVNSTIKAEMKLHNMTYWQLADLLGVAESTLYRWFRHELPEEEKQRILAVIRKEGETVVSD